MVVGRVMVLGGGWTLHSLALTPLAGSGAFVLGSCVGAIPRNAPRGSQVERMGPRRTQRWVPRVLLEDLQGNGGVLDGHDHASVVQVEDVMLLLEHLQETAGGALRAGAGEGLGALRVGGRSPRDRAAHTLAGGLQQSPAP